MVETPNSYAHLADDAEMIQAAVDAAALTGVRVVIPRHNDRTDRDIWILERAIRLHTGSTVCLDGCHLRLADGSFDNIFKNDIARTDAAHDLRNRQYDIHIYGVGNAVLDGGNHNGLVERNARYSANSRFEYSTFVNTMIHFHNAERISVENLRIVNARYWGITFHYCSSGRVSNVDFMSSGNCPNQDGVDLRTGCFDFIIENITGYTQDDSVALTCLNDRDIEVEGLDASIHNVIIRNIATATLCANVRLLNHCGKKLYNVIIENVQSSVEIDPASPAAEDFTLRLPDAEPVEWAMKMPYWSTFENRNRRAHACVRIGENGYFDPSDPDGRAILGDTFNITVRNVQARSQIGVAVSRTLCDSSFDGIQMFGDGAVAVYLGEGNYENLRFSNVSFAHNMRLREEDKAPRGGNYGYEHPAAVLFNGSHARDLSFDGLTTHPAGQDAFSGHGDVEFSARNVSVRAQGRLVHGAGLKISEMR